MLCGASAALSSALIGTAMTAGGAHLGMRESPMTRASIKNSNQKSVISEFGSVCLQGTGGIGLWA